MDIGEKLEHCYRQARGLLLKLDNTESIGEADHILDQIKGLTLRFSNLLAQVDSQYRSEWRSKFESLLGEYLDD